MSKKLLSLFVAVLMLFGVMNIPAFANLAPKAAPLISPDLGEGTAIVIFTNDVHCGIEDGWGYAGVAAVKKQCQAFGYDVMLVDAGDHVQGGPIGTLSRGQYIINIMNFVGYDLAVPGNHEYDYTMDQFFNLVNSANYPYISANFMNYENGQPTTPVLDAYRIYEMGGQKIAFVGLSTPETLVKSTPTYFMNDDGEYIYGFCQDETGEGVYTACQNAVDAARAEGADRVVVIGHMGVDEQSDPWRSTDVIAHVNGVDAFIDGHSHSVLSETVPDKDGNPVYLLQTGTKLANLGFMAITAQGISCDVLPVPENLVRDPVTTAYIDGIKVQYEELLNTEVAYTEFDLTVNDPVTGVRIVRNRETNLGDICADAYRTLFDSDIAFVNGGGVRANIPTGPVTFGQILNVHPFGNAACLVEVTGQQILDALEMGARNCPADNGGFLQVSGLTYEINTQLEPNVVLGSDGVWTGSAGIPYRVQNVRVMDRETGEYMPLDLSRTYTLASHNYMLKNCGDGYGMFGTNNVTLLADEVMLDNAVLINYFQSMPGKEIDGVEYEHVIPEEYSNPYGQGRITILGLEPPIDDHGDKAVILFTNDVHCGIEDGWGYAGVAGARKAYEAEGWDPILVDAGDHVQGGPIGTLSRGQYIIDIMNYVGYDLACPGNHEFDYTMDQFFNLVNYANYPYVSANFMNYVDGAPTTPVLEAYKMFEREGIKIAFVGLSTPETLVKSTPTYFMNEDREYIYGFCQDDTGEGVYTICQNAIDAAKADGADYVIVVGHMGVDEQSYPWRSTDVIANISGCDFFIDGHSHSVLDEIVMDKDGNPVHLLQTGTKLANLGKIEIYEDGTVIAGVYPPEEGMTDPVTAAYIDGIKLQYEELLNTEVAYTEFLLTVNDPETGARIVRKQETNLGDLCADAYRTLFDADIAFVNGGGVRANIPEGPITFGQIINVHPFGNAACLVEVTGQQILDALEMGARNCPSENGGFLQCSGITYEIHTSLEPNVVLGTDGIWTGPAGIPYRVQNVRVMDRETGEYMPLDVNRTYTLASHNYMLKNCGDGYGMFGTNNVTLLADEVMLDNAVLINYFQSMPAKEIDGVEYDHVVSEEYADPYGQGRIVIVPEEGDPYAIHAVYVDGFGTPVAGVAGIDHMFLTTPEDAPYFIIYGGWRDETDQQQMWSEDHVFIPGHMYSEGAQIWAEDGYYFADDCVFYGNGGTEILDLEWCYVDEADNWICYINTIPVVCEPAGSGVMGDIDGNGVVDANDALILMRYVLGLAEIDQAQLPMADVDGDQSISMTDALLILRFVLGVIDSFPGGAVLE